MKDISKIIKEFEKLPYKGYAQKSPKNESTGSSFYLERQLAKCMMIADVLNSHIDPVSTKMNGTQQIPILHVFDLGERKPKDILADGNLPQVCSTDKSKSERVIVDEMYMEESESESVQKIIDKN